MSPARYGQHFLINQEAIAQIVAALKVTPGDVVLEIGPGLGALTVPLLKAGALLTSVEVDPKMIDYLRKNIPPAPQFTLMHEDFLSLDLNRLASSSTPTPFKLAGNLPYNITSPILRKLSEWAGWSFAVIMVQKEVGDRLCASPGTPDFGALTVGVSLTCEVSPIFSLTAKDFNPRPRVDSLVLKLTRRLHPLTARVPQTQKIIQAAFQQRRKTILNSLSHGLNIPKESVGITLSDLGIDPWRRAETLSVSQFIQLADKLFP